MEIPNPQQDHYETIHDEYAAHYYDDLSMLYRKQFIFEKLFLNKNLNGKLVADLACGDGYNSLFLKDKYPNVKLHGFDISPSACSTYEKITGAPATCCDLIIDTEFEQTFDTAIIIGGLHHLVAGLDSAMKNISCMLKTGGTLLAVEPNKRFVLNCARNLWYHVDRYFDAPNEESLNVNDLSNDCKEFFQLKRIYYFGGPAYFFILNSLMFRLHKNIKQTIAPFLFKTEHVYNSYDWPPMYPAFIAEWQKL